MIPYFDRPCAAPGFVSYRYRGRYGWIMIGAHTDAEALKEANRSLSSGKAELQNLQIWDGKAYRAVDNQK